MKKFKFGSLAGLLVLLSVSAFAEGRLPVNIQNSFSKALSSSNGCGMGANGRLLRGRIYCR